MVKMQVIVFISILTFSCSQEQKTEKESAKKENIEGKVKQEEEHIALDFENEEVEVLRYYNVNELAGYMDTCSTLGLYPLDGILTDGDTITYEDVNSRFFGLVSKLCLGYRNYNRNKEKEDLQDIRESRKELVEIIKNSGLSIEVLQGLLIGLMSKETIQEFPDTFKASKGM